MGAVRFLFLSTGRIHRAKFWLGLLISKIVLLGSIAAIGLTAEGYAAGAVSLPLYLWVLSAVSAKRLHDMGMSGWWFAVMLIGPAVLGGVGGATNACPAGIDAQRRNSPRPVPLPLVGRG